MAALKSRSIANVRSMNLLLRGGIYGGARLSPVVYGLHGKTLVFTSPSKTVTFSDPTQAGLPSGSIIRQILSGTGTPAATTEGTVDLVASYPAIGTETLIISIDGGGDVTVTFASEANSTALLAKINATTVPLGVTASLGTGTPNGLVLTGTTGGSVGTIEVKGGTVNALVGISTETVSGTNLLEGGFFDGQLQLIEAAPASGVALDCASSTAATQLGFPSSGSVAGTVYAAPDGSAPRLVAFSPGNQMDNIVVMTEE